MRKRQTELQQQEQGQTSDTDGDGLEGSTLDPGSTRGNIYEVLTFVDGSRH